MAVEFPQVNKPLFSLFEQGDTASKIFLLDIYLDEMSSIILPFLSPPLNNFFYVISALSIVRVLSLSKS